MHERLVITVPPAAEPLSLDEAKLHLRVDIDEDDALISGLIVAARMHVETWLSQALVTQTLLYTIDGFPWGGGYFNREIRQLGVSPWFLPTNQGIIRLPRPPLQSVLSMTYVGMDGGTYTIDPSLYKVVGGVSGSTLATPGRIQPVYGMVWPIARPEIDSVAVSYAAGYGAPAAVPATAKTAMKLLIGHWYDNREAVVVGTTASRVPDAVAALLATLDHGGYS